MNKKVISAVLAGAMAVSALGVSVSAATATEKTVKTAGATTYKITGTLAAPEINVTLPSSVSAVVNPYGVSFEMRGQTYGAQGVTSPVYTIKNNTTASAVSVVATATLTVPTTKTGTGADAVVTPNIIVTQDEGDIATENAKDKGDAKKTIYAVVAGYAPTAAVTADKIPGYVDPNDATKVVKDTQLFTVGDTSAVDGVTTLKFKDVTMSTKDAPITGDPDTLMVIPKAVPAKDSTPAKIGYGQFQLGGSVTEQKKTPWTSADKLTINLVLDIGPAADPTT